MSQWKRWNRRKRLLLTAAAVILLTTSTWTAVSSREAFGQESESELKAPVPPPEEVYIQQRDNADGLGNIYVLVQLSSAQTASKLRDGTADFLTIGTPDNLVILRDDGGGGDTAAADRLYTGIASIDPAALQLRAREDQAEYDSQSSKLVPRFEGRAAVGVEEPVPFDYAAFTAGEVVRFGPAVAFLEPETLSPSQEEATPVAGALSSSESEGSPRLITSGISSPTPVSPSVNAFQKRVLMITSPNVVADPARTWDPCTNMGAPNGVWTFNHLMTQMANQPLTGILPADFVETWLQNWLSATTINQDPLPARTRMNQILNQWPRLSNGKLDLNQSPLRLLAIAPRLDLRRTTGGGGSYQTSSSGNFLDAGELRFIFGFVAKKTSSFDPAQQFLGAAQIGTSTCYALPFTVIFEYRVPKTPCQDVKAWAQAWTALRNQPLWGPYRTHLESLTQQIVVANANPNNPNGSALGQLRTNEVALDAPWELREFRLQQPASFLVASTVEDTIRNDPASDYNNGSNGPLFRQYVQTVVEPLLPPFEGAIPVIPLIYQTQAFKAGDSRVPETNPALITFHWNDPNLNVVTNLAENWARHRVSRASCNGCHRREVFTHFVHVNPADTIPSSNPALPAELSVFLTGINGLGDPANALATGALPVSNPNNGNPKRNFDDLARREKDLKAVAKMSCSGMPKANSAHVNSHFRATGQLPDNLFEGMRAGQQLSVAIDDILRNFVFEVH